MKVKDIGVKNIYYATQNMKATELASLMKQYGVRAIPVCHGNQIIGIVTEGDIITNCLAAGKDPGVCQAKDLMSANPKTVTPETDLEEAAKIMAKTQTSRLPIVDFNNKILGMLSIGDIARALTGNDHLLAETLREMSTPSQTVPPW